MNSVEPLVYTLILALSHLLLGPKFIKVVMTHYFSSKIKNAQFLKILISEQKIESLRKNTVGDDDEFQRRNQNLKFMNSRFSLFELYIRYLPNPFHTLSSLTHLVLWPYYIKVVITHYSTIISGIPPVRSRKGKIIYTKLTTSSRRYRDRETVFTPIILQAKLETPIPHNSHYWTKIWILDQEINKGAYKL